MQVAVKLGCRSHSICLLRSVKLLVGCLTRNTPCTKHLCKCFRVILRAGNEEKDERKIEVTQFLHVALVSTTKHARQRTKTRLRQQKLQQRQVLDRTAAVPYWFGQKKSKCACSKRRETVHPEDGAVRS